MQQFAVVVKNLNENQTKPPAHVLSNIKSVLFSYFKVKEEQKVVTGTKGMKNPVIPTVSMSKKEMDAFYEAGMPSPMDKWLKDYRKKQNGKH